MKVLFDQNLPHKLRSLLMEMAAHEIFTAAWLGWGDLRNGELLRAAEEGGMDVFVTGDTTLRYEQNLTGRHLAIVVLSANNWPIVREHAVKILAAIEGAGPGSFVVVDCGKFSR